MLDYFRILDWREALLLFLVENALVILLSLLFGYALKYIFHQQENLLASSKNISSHEWLIACSTLLINTGITFTGFWLWREGYIKIQTGFSPLVVMDFVFLFIGMDFLMYAFHYVVHKTFLYRYIHQLHHYYTEPQPIDLFVLHPIETIGFGSLWLGLMFIYPAHFEAIIAYLTANVLFGVLGHSGLEPFPKSWSERPILKYIGSSTFHFQHHQHAGYNFGFYTTIWDHIFGTIAPHATSEIVK